MDLWTLLGGDDLPNLEGGESPASLSGLSSTTPWGWEGVPCNCHGNICPGSPDALHRHCVAGEGGL